MSLRTKRTGLPEDVAFPVTPFLDMAFQLLAFFILTFRPPSQETRLDLLLPSSAYALPAGRPSPTNRIVADDQNLETDLRVRVDANDRGEIASLFLGTSSVKDVDDLELRLRRYLALVEGAPVRVQLDAPDDLKYEHAAKVIGACVAAGVAAVKLEEAPR